MKKALIFTFILLIQLIPIYASGWQELLPDWVKSDKRLESSDGELVINKIGIQQRFGQSYVVISGLKFNGANISKGLVYQQGKFYGLSSELIDSDIIDTEMVNIPGSPTDIDSSLLNPYVSNLQYLGFDADQNLLDYMRQSNMFNKISFPVPVGDNVETILLFHSLSDDISDIKISIRTSITDLLQDETYALNTLYPGKAYINQVAMALGSYFYDKDSTSEKSDLDKYIAFLAKKEINVSKSEIETVYNGNKDIVDDFNVSLVQHIAKGLKFYKDLEGTSESTPYLRFDPESFRSLYSNSEPSLYIHLYLQFLLDLGKPLFSSYYADQYNYNDYECIDSATGITIAENALRYINWGVEYTGIENLPQNSSNPIYSIINEGDWLNPANDNRMRNYHSEGFDSTSLDGNPLPYSPLGIDSPRSFAKKMSTQVREGNATTLAENDNFSNYGNSGYKPGNVNSSISGYDESEYDPSKSAGVDPVGFLVGVASMSNIDLVKKNNVSNPSDVIDTVYHELDVDSLDYAYYAGSKHRLNGADLELTSVLVPSISEFRVGDFLVKYDKEGNVAESAVIIGVPSFSLDDLLEDNLESISVVAISRSLKQVTYSNWASLDGREEFQVRRFLNKKIGSSNGASIVGWEIVDDSPYYIECIVDFFETIDSFIPERLNDNHFTEWGTHYIPNTGDPLMLENIFFRITDKAGESPISYIGREIELELLEPKDPYYDSSKSNEGNIFNNLGEGEVLKLGYKDEDGNLVDIAAFYKNTDMDSYLISEINSGSFYAKNYIITNDLDEGNANDVQFSLSSDHDKIFKLVFIRDGEIKPHSNFFVMSGDGSKPGDDFLLNFGLKDHKAVFTSPPDDDMSFLAVYDKKMIWRANLYIDENNTLSSQNDWNNLHKWIVGNAWNKSPKQEGGSEPDPSRMYVATASDWTDGLGGQVIEIAPFTAIRAQTGTNVVTGRVAYDYPYDSTATYITSLSTDSPFNFNRKMFDQMAKIKNTAAVGDWPINGIALSILQIWATTRAPFDAYNNYRKDPIGSDYPGLPGIGLYFYGDHDTITSKPTFSSNLVKQSVENIGVDCVGFAKRAASYAGDSYKWTNYSEVQWLDDEVSDGIQLRSDGYPHVSDKVDVIIDRLSVSSSNSYFTTPFLDDLIYYTGYPGPRESDFKTLQKRFLSIKPGDIIHYDSSHIGIVDGVNAEIIKEATTIVAMMKGIRTIESTFGSRINYVTKRNMMQGPSGVNWVSDAQGSWHYGWKPSSPANAPIPIRNWSIERLKVN